MDKLDIIFQKQQAFNDEIVKTRHLEHVTGDEWLQKYTLATLSELGEMLDGTNFKWWKNPKERDMDYIKEEIVDLLHFFVSLSLSVGMDAEELYERYCRKNQENFDRQQGKTEKPGYDIHELNQD